MAQEQKTQLSEFDKIWKLMMENREQMKETDRQMKETDRQMKETDRQMKETDRQVQETSRQMKETDKKLNKFMGETGNRWGALGENLVEGNLAKRLKEKGFEVEGVLTRLRKRGHEFDIVAVNGKEIVVVEVKATLDPSDVDEFVEKLIQFKTLWPAFKDCTIYGAMAFLINVNRQADARAEKEGFFVIKATGDVIIQNKEKFKPKIFH